MLQLSVCPSDATEGQRKRLDLQTSYAVSLATERLQKLERGGSVGASHGIGYRQEQQPTGEMVLESGNTGCCDLQLVKQPDS